MSNAVFQAVGKTPLCPHASLSAPVAPTPRDILPALPPAGSHARCPTAPLLAVLSLLFGPPPPVSSVCGATSPLPEVVLCEIHLFCSLVTLPFPAAVGFARTLASALPLSACPFPSYSGSPVLHHILIRKSTVQS